MGRASDPRFSTTAGCGRAKKPARWRVRGSSSGRDGSCPLARRALMERADDDISLRPPRVGRRQRRRRMIRQGSKHKAASRRSVWKTATRDVDLVETVKLQNSTGRGPASRALPIPSPGHAGGGRNAVRGVQETRFTPRTPSEGKSLRTPRRPRGVAVRARPSPGAEGARRAQSDPENPPARWTHAPAPPSPSCPLGVFGVNLHHRPRPARKRTAETPNPRPWPATVRHALPAVKQTCAFSTI